MLLEIVPILLIVWGISALIGMGRRKMQQAARQDRSEQPFRQDPAADAPQRPAQPQRPMRPVDVDLPGQTTMPIHWDGHVDPSHDAQPDDWLTTPLYYDDTDDRIRPLEHALAEEHQRVQTSETRPVHIPGLNLRLTADALVKGVIFSEILTRPTARRMPCRRPQ